MGKEIVDTKNIVDLSNVDSVFSSVNNGRDESLSFFCAVKTLFFAQQFALQPDEYFTGIRLWVLLQ